MSNALFPSLPGLTWDVERTPTWATNVQTSRGGLELRETYWSRPIYQYTLAYELLRQGGGYTELATLVRFFQDRQGAYDSFLYSDPSDSVASGMGCGVGDGATTAFQLQRSLGGQVSDALGTWTKAVIPTWNTCLYSQDLSNAAWTKNTGVTALANAALAPDGTPTASRLAYDGSGIASDYRAYASGPGRARGVSYLTSVWLRADAPITLSLADNASSTTVSVTTAWQRFSMPAAVVGDGFGVSQCTIGAASGSNSAFGIFVWGAQVENVVAGQTLPGPNIATAGAVTRGRPSFWPSSGDGFEPITEPGVVTLTRVGDWQGPVVLSCVARTNLMLRSGDFSVAPWASGNGCTAVLGAGGTAPDVAGARTYLKNATGVVSSYRVQQFSGAVVGQTYTFSFWVLGDGTNTQCDVAFVSAIGANIATGGVLMTGPGSAAFASGKLTVTGLSASAWTRVALTGVAVDTTPRVLIFSNGASGVAVTGVYAFGAQVEDGLVAGDYIATAGAMASRTDFTFSNPGGVVTLAVAPATSAFLTWSGTYYWRCRFEDDQTAFQNFLYQLWEAKQVRFRTVK